MVTEKAFEEYDEILKYTERLCFMSCGIELQVKALECLGSTRQGLAERKKEACEGLDEGVANLALGYEALMDCQRSSSSPHFRPNFFPTPFALS